ncbi:uncharacterized protein LOC115731515 isoform X1 [Rhodamnia argentea]|uniref:Uncharacterized protein LOC115731515 isoform X1 n=1 Tax=Rhodamnia argentea TaxID=178133 RepID=A0ABM3H5F3_9MYRT|nr:uncharacterized protein LOC115731515 isoform X1 [Rhodamnia argentea]
MSPLTVRPEQCQHVLVMRHGERADDGADKSWWTTVPNPWDAPLTDAGRARALETGRKLRDQLGFPIHRVVVSPFRRCVETAQGLISGLFPVDAGNLDNGNSADSSASRIKVSIEFGLGELFNNIAIRHPPPNPADHGAWGFNIPTIEALIPAETLDHTVKPVFNELPQWGETEPKARDRYRHTIRSLADRYPSENLPLITHGEAVKVAASTYWKEARGQKIRPGYCGCVHLKRQVVRNGDSFTAKRFEIATNPKETGIKRKLPQQA